MTKDWILRLLLFVWMYLLYDCFKLFSYSIRIHYMYIRLAKTLIIYLQLSVQASVDVTLSRIFMKVVYA